MGLGHHEDAVLAVNQSMNTPTLKGLRTRGLINLALRRYELVAEDVAEGLKLYPDDEQLRLLELGVRYPYRALFSMNTQW